MPFSRKVALLPYHQSLNTILHKFITVLHPACLILQQNLSLSKESSYSAIDEILLVGYSSHHYYTSRRSTPTKLGTIKTLLDTGLCSRYDYKPFGAQKKGDVEVMMIERIQKPEQNSVMIVFLHFNTCHTCHPPFVQTECPDRTLNGTPSRHEQTSRARHIQNSGARRNLICKRCRCKASCTPSNRTNYISSD